MMCRFVCERECACLAVNVVSRLLMMCRFACVASCCFVVTPSISRGFSSSPRSAFHGRATPRATGRRRHSRLRARRFTRRRAQHQRAVSCNQSTCTGLRAARESYQFYNCSSRVLPFNVSSRLCLRHVDNVPQLPPPAHLVCAGQGARLRAPPRHAGPPRAWRRRRLRVSARRLLRTPGALLPEQGEAGALTLPGVLGPDA